MFIALLKETHWSIRLGSSYKHLAPTGARHKTFRTIKQNRNRLAQFFSKITSAMACSVVWAMEMWAEVAPDCS